MLEYYDHQQLGEERVYFFFQLLIIVHHEEKSTKGLQARTLWQEWSRDHWEAPAYSSLLAQFSYTAQGCHDLQWAGYSQIDHQTSSAPQAGLQANLAVEVFQLLLANNSCLYQVDTKLSSIAAGSSVMGWPHMEFVFLNNEKVTLFQLLGRRFHQFVSE